jgi:hypothetical protein
MTFVSTSWHQALLLFVVAIFLTCGFARRFGAPIWLALCIPNVPLALLLVYHLIFDFNAIGQGGPIPDWILLGLLLAVSFLTSVLTAFVVPERPRPPSKHK